MSKLTPLSSLVFFEENLPFFIKEDGRAEELIIDLKQALTNETGHDFHANILRSGKEFIKYIITKSIEYLSDESGSPKNSSVRKVNKYIDAFVLFEEMLFGLSQTYRDHTLHSLWVYLYGHEFITQMGGYETLEIAGQINITYFIGNKPIFVLLAPPVKGSVKHLEAMWGMVSILHDLGYPVEAISNKPNEVFGQILDPFAIDFSTFFQMEIGSRIGLLHQSICDLLATIYRPEHMTPEETEKLYKETANNGSEGLRSIPRQPTTTNAEAIEMEFRIASVDKIHSAWSAILAFKNIAYLHESDQQGGGNRDFLKLLTRRDVLYSIVHHTSEEPKDLAVNRLQFILLLMDDIEEATRYSRGGKERGVVSDYCDASWEVNENATQIQLDYTNYDCKAESKYSEIANKYKAQASRRQVNGRYEIEFSFVDNDFRQHTILYLNKG